MAEMSQKTGLPVTYALLQNPMDKDSWRTLLQMTEDAVADGANIKAQIALRAPGLILGWESTVHPSRCTLNISPMPKWNQEPVWLN